MPRKQLQARFDPDVVEAVEAYADDHDISRSEAMRRMLRGGLSAQGYEIATPDGGTTTADALDELRSEQTEHFDQLRQDLQILLGGLAVGVVAAVVVAAGLSPAISLIALWVGAIVPSFAFGATVFRRVVSE